MPLHDTCDRLPLQAPKIRKAKNRVQNVFRVAASKPITPASPPPHDRGRTDRVVLRLTHGKSGVDQFNFYPPGPNRHTFATGGGTRGLTDTVSRHSIFVQCVRDQLGTLNGDQGIG